MDNIDSIMHLMQFAGGSFPIGGFSHSFGLESYTEKNSVRNIAKFREFLQTSLNTSLGCVEAPAVCLAYRYMQSGDSDSLIRLDNLITALKPTMELRQASRKMGRGFLKIFCELYPENIVNDYLYYLKNTNVGGNYSVVFGLAVSALNIDIDSAVTAYLYSSISAAVQAGIKLVPLCRIESQKLLIGFYGNIKLCAEAAQTISEEELSGFSPSLDIASMQHEKLYTRLYMS